MGSGLFISTGSALRVAGPGNMLIGYGIVCTLVAAVLNTVAEMTIAFPESGNFISYADRWVDPALAFAAGFAEWLAWGTVPAAEATFFNVLVNYWAGGSVHEAVWLTIFIVIVTSIFLLPNEAFAWFAYITSIIRIFAFVVIVIASIAILCGAGPRGYVHNGANWTDHAFQGGFSGFSFCMLYGLWAMSDQIMTGILAGEAKNPRLSMAHATKLVPIRVGAVYVTTIILISFLVPMDNDMLFGSSGAAASPYVIGMKLAGIPGLPDFLNAVIIVGCLSVAAETIFIPSRILRAMSHQGLLPKVLAKVDSRGRPVYALGVTVTFTYILTYINLSNTGIEIYTWLSSIASSSFFCVWMIMSITSWRFRAALKAQNDRLFEGVHAYHTSGWPFTPIWLFTGSLLLFICCVYQAVGGGSDVSAYTFFQYMLGFILIVSSYLGYKVIFRTKLRDPCVADLRTGRLMMSDEQLQEWETYCALPWSRRFATYAKIW